MEAKDCVSPKHYTDLRVQALDEKFDARLAGVDRATKIAADALEKRLDAFTPSHYVTKEQLSAAIGRTIGILTALIILASAVVGYLSR